MKIAVISDIHGNMEALNSVMNDIEKRDCDKVFVLGDYAMAGPEPNLAVDYFMSKINNSNFTMIQGNTDLMITDYSDELYKMLKSKAPIMAEALRNDSELLNDNQKLFLKNLPPQREIEVDGIKFLLVHGSPRKNNEDIMPNLPMEKLEDMIKGVNANVILCGHTHIPCGYQTQSKITVINDGSVGRPFTKNPQACYLIITIENGECTFEHQFIDYDKELASQKLLKRNFEGKEKLAQMLINPEERHF